MTYEATAEMLRSHDQFLLAAHPRPDADALGAVFALSRVLEGMGKDVVSIVPDSPDRRFRFIDKDQRILTYREGKTDTSDWKDRLLVLLDTSPDNIGELYSPLFGSLDGNRLIKDKGTPRGDFKGFRDYLIIDHHDHSPDIQAPHLIDSSMSSTCEMLYNTIRLMEGPLDLDTAEALYAGIVFDTGSFVYPKTGKASFLVAYELVSLGVIPNAIFTHLYESSSTASLKLQSRVLSTLQLFLDEQVSMIEMDTETLESTGSRYGDSGSLINIPLQCEKIRVSIFFKTDEKGHRRCSLRSKGRVDVSRIAESFGGGGHKTASGFGFDENQDQVLNRLLSLIAQDLPPLPANSNKE